MYRLLVVASTGRTSFAMTMSRMIRERLMGLEAIYPKPRLSLGNPEHRKFPYLLRGLSVNRVNQVWATDTGRTHQNSGRKLSKTRFVCAALSELAA